MGRPVQDAALGRPTRLLGVCLLIVAVGAAARAPGAAADVTAPVITRTVTGPSGDAGWHLGPVHIGWTVTDPESLWTSTGCDAQALSQETAGVSFECRAQSAGGSSSNGLSVKIDSTAPTVTSAAPDRPADRAGWHNRPVTVAFAGSDALSGLASCLSTTYAGPDSADAAVNGTCRDRAGNTSAPLAFKLSYDATGPEIRGMRASRPPDRAGWYDHPVRLRFRARDAVSGGARCRSTTYRGPDGPAVEVQAACVDRAGNSSVRAFRLRYDATPPELSLQVLPGDRSSVLSWRAAPDARRFVVVRWIARQPWTRRVVYRGRARRHVDAGLSNRHRYRYAVIATDAAGNRSRRSGVSRPGRRVLAPRRAARLDGPPLLRWTSVPGARFYNVQLFRGDTRVLSAWPRRPRYRMPVVWQFDGRPMALEPGRYRWYVWPARGRHSDPRYGRRVGQSRFIITAPQVGG